MLGLALQNLGWVANLEETFLQAQQFLQEALAIFQTTNNPYLETYVIKNLGDAALGLQQFETAEQYYTQALELANTMHIKEITCSAWIGMAKMYNAQGLLAASQTITSKAYNLAIEIENIDFQNQCLALMQQEEAQH